MRFYLGVVLILTFLACRPLLTRADEASSIPTLEQAMASKTDLWGELAMKQPNGPSYEFFAQLLPSLRYVNADFRFYPIVLSAPCAKLKARLISNGSGINLRGGARAWNDVGTAVQFRVGPDEFLFGGLEDRLSQPALAEGWLPIVEIRYRHSTPLLQGGNVPLAAQTPRIPQEIYRLEAFAATEPALASNGVVFVKFDLAQGTNGTITLQFDDPPASLEKGHLVRTGSKTKTRGQDDSDRFNAALDTAWRSERGRFLAKLKPGTSATLAIATRPVSEAFECSTEIYAKQRELCAETWRDLIADGCNLESPEPVVNNAWRHLICQNFELINGDRIHYSFGNQYDKLYESEGSDAALALMVWGQNAEMRKLVVPLLDFTRKGLEFHQAGFKLNDVTRYYWQTRDAAAVRELRPHWEREARRLAENRTAEHGLFPKEQYCGDISTFVYSLNANSKAWRALRDLSAVLDEIGESDAKHYKEVAAEFRPAILKAIADNIHRDSTPPFVPVALYADEPTHDPILHSRIGSYWNIIIGYTIGSGIFPPGSPEENWIPHFQEQHGGLCMGMLRAGHGFSFWTSPNRINPLYGTRYALDVLRRDDPERALVSFYGMLAQGFSTNTFVSAEGCSLTPLDAGGRMMYCPPNSAANAHLLSMLRTMLVQDWDLDDNGKPETLRLLFATPRRWLEDGKQIKVERAPTAFGPVSVKVESRLSQGEVRAELDLPQRNHPERTLLRIRVPEGWRAVSARAGTKNFDVDAQGTVDLSSLSGKQIVSFQVSRS
ncbi:MAG: hypothetical protein C5B50_22040 [Verrucomicrobia bacterium]|nr:MAG: hypothetical protein C5B50_22040 [Verrucomicrobiota bacterium]